MGETILRFGLDEITTYRVRCKTADCGVSVEIPAGKASKALKGTLTCPACHNHLWEVGESGKALDDLQDAARRVKGFGISLEFVVTKADVDAK